MMPVSRLVHVQKLQQSTDGLQQSTDLSRLILERVLFGLKLFGLKVVIGSTTCIMKEGFPRTYKMGSRVV